MTTIGIIHGEDIGQTLPEELYRIVRCSKCGHTLPLKDVETVGDCLMCPKCGEIEELWEEVSE